MIDNIVGRSEPETIISPVEGYRMWYVPYEKVQLQSPVLAIVWKPLERVEAHCLNDNCVCKGIGSLSPSYASNFDSPNRTTCNSGVYAHKMFEQGLKAYLYEIKMFAKYHSAPTEHVAFGMVYLWGEVVEHERGFRGQYAYPSGVYYTARNSAALAAAYRIPLIRNCVELVSE
jgi:hypothetical protein